jgi:uncharacterized protein (TIGR02391 family)
MAYDVRRGVSNYDEKGDILSTNCVTTLSEAEKKSKELRTDLINRGVHPDVLKFCKEELLQKNYFHAVLEATKSVAEKIRHRTGLLDDGAPLADRALGGNPPMLAINALTSESEKSEQKGFLNLVKGMFGMFRNPTAHSAKIEWQMNKEDAEDLFSILSLIHKRIDKSHMPPRV